MASHIDISRPCQHRIRLLSKLQAKQVAQNPTFTGTVFAPTNTGFATFESECEVRGLPRLYCCQPDMRILCSVAICPCTP